MTMITLTELTLKNARAISQQGMDILQKEDQLSVNCAELYQVDSSALAVFLSWQREADSLGKSLKLLNIPPQLTNLAAVYGIEELLPLSV